MSKSAPSLNSDRFSVVIEWENLRFSDITRARAMLVNLGKQVAELGIASNRRPQIIILYDQHEVDRQSVSDMVCTVLPQDNAYADIQIVATRGLRYYELKSFGAAQAAGDIIVFLDCDVIPEDGWLAGLLEAFQNPEVAVVGGNTYLSPEGLYGKAFALFWLFPLRSEGSRLRAVKNFYANNVAFRRQVLEKHDFPVVAAYRKQCVLLAETLTVNDIQIFLQERSRTIHPPPNGIRHFVNRAVCEGYDAVFYQTHRGARWPTVVAGAF